MANVSKYDPSVSIVSPLDLALDLDPNPELTVTEYRMGVSASTDMYSTPLWTMF